MIDVEAIHAQLAGRFGPEVAAWCESLPTLADDLARQWGLRLGRAWQNGGTSVVLPCESGEGEPMVLKLTPDPKIAEDEATALDAWMDCRHVVTLYDTDRGRGALLLNRVLPGTRLAHEPGRWTLENVLPVLAGIWQHRVLLRTGSEVPQLRARAEFVFGLTQRRLDRTPAVARLVQSDLVEASWDLAITLAVQGPVLLHGDLHPGNVLRGMDGLVAIDPHRTWAWCQALAIGRLSRDTQDSAGEEMLAVARIVTARR